MASETHEAILKKRQNRVQMMLRNLGSDVKPAQGFVMKFANDWVMNLAAALAYNLLTAMFPIALAILSILGFFLGSNEARNNLAHQLLMIFPTTSNTAGTTNSLLQVILLQLSHVSGLFGILALLLAFFGGSRLFILLEGCFAIIYHLKPRTFIPQNLVALGMLILFIVLTPLMILASSVPSLVISFLQRTPFSRLPGIGFVFSLGGIASSLIVSMILFSAIYTIVPNRRISWHTSWRGALVASVLLVLYLTVFSLYVSLFMRSFVGQVGFAVILLTFFFYFAVIILLGAEVNAFYGERVSSTPKDLVTLVYEVTSALPPRKTKAERRALIKERYAEPQDPAPTVAQSPPAPSPEPEQQD